MNELSLEYIQFKPVKRDKSLIGFVSFKIGREFSFYQLAVHTLLKPKNNIKIRLVYPEKQEPSQVMQEFIDEEINAYLLANYHESLI